MRRRSFLGKVGLSTTALSATPFFASSLDSLNHALPTISAGLNLSLAQWSIHRNLKEGSLQAVDFADIAIDKYGINAIEYVNGFYTDSGEDEQFWLNMKERADSAGVTSLLIMVDEEGDLGTSSEKKRIKSVENHYKWVNAAKMLGCHSIRVNAFGDENKDVYLPSIVDGLGRLSDYAAKENINILMISTSEIKISVVVAEKYMELAVRALHSEFDLQDA